MRRDRCNAALGWFVLLCSGAVGPACAAPQTTREPGPARRESRLLDWVRSEYLGDVAGPIPDSDGEVSTPVRHWLEATLGDPDPPPGTLELPDAASLRVVARCWPVPTPEWMAECLLESMRGVDREVDSALLDWLAKLPAEARQRSLLQVVERARAGRLSTPTFAQAVRSLGHDEPSTSTLSTLHEGRLRPEVLVRHFAARAFEEEMERAARQEHPWEFAACLSSLEPGAQWSVSPLIVQSLELALFAPPPVGFPIDVQATAARFERRLDTDGIVCAIDLKLARFWQEFFAGAERTALEALLSAAANPARSTLAHEDRLRVKLLEVELLRGFVRASFGEDPREELRAAIESSAVDQDQCFVDQAAFAALSPSHLARPIGRSGHAATLVRFEAALVDAIEAGRARTGYGTLERDPDRDEGTSSWLFVHHADHRRRWLNEGEAALEDLARHSAVLAASTRWENRFLYAELCTLQGEIHVDRGEAAAAHAAFAAALATLDALDELWRDSVIEAEDDGRPELPAPELQCFRLVLPGDALRARVLWSRAGLRAMLENDADGAAKDVFAAGTVHEWDGDRWLQTALDLARRGHEDRARAALRCVVPVPDRLYNVAATESWMGDAQAAVDHLRRFLAEQCYTKESRAFYAALAARDPDFSRVHSHPGFPAVDEPR